MVIYIYIYILCDIVYSGANSSNEQTGDPTGHWKTPSSPEKLTILSWVQQIDGFI